MVDWAGHAYHIPSSSVFTFSQMHQTFGVPWLGSRPADFLKRKAAIFEAKDAGHLLSQRAHACLMVIYDALVKQWDVCIVRWKVNNANTLRCFPVFENELTAVCESV